MPLNEEGRALRGKVGKGVSDFTVCRCHSPPVSASCADVFLPFRMVDSCLVELMLKMGLWSACVRVCVEEVEGIS